MAHSLKTENTPLVAGDSFKQIGLTLKQARRSQKLSVKEVSQNLRISIDYLTMLEAGAFHDLPAPAYVNGFLRSYGRYVGLVPDTLVARYTALIADEDTKPSYQIPMGTRPPQRSAPAVASILLLFAGLAYGGWFWLKTDNQPEDVVVETAAKIKTLLPSQDNVAIDLATFDSPATVLPELNDSTDRLSTLEPDPAMGLSIEERELTANKMADINPEGAQSITEAAEKLGWATIDARISELTAAETPNPVLSGELSNTQVVTPPSLKAGDMQNGNLAIANLRDPAKEITIRAVAASWVEIVRDNGEEVMAKLMQAGDSYVVDEKSQLYLSTGNAGGLVVIIGAGDPLSVGQTGEIVRDLPLATDKLRKAL